MVFPIGAQIRELAADHLDRLPGKSLIDGLIHKCGVTNDGHARCANQPEHGREGRSPQTKRHGDDDESSVELRSASTEGTNLKIIAVEAANDPHAGDDKDDVEEQDPVGEQSIDAEHDKDDSIVAREMAQVIVDARLHLGKVGGLRDSLHVEELGQRSKVGEATTERTRAKALEALAKVDAGRNDVQRDLNASHGD